jgi:uncharacterized protein
MTPSAPTATPAGRLPQPLRGMLRGVLLRGLRAPRLPHAPGWTEAAAGTRSLLPFAVHGARGQRLAAWMALPEWAAEPHAVSVVVAVHGWGANASTLAPVIEPLTRAGIAVVLFDAANHGESSHEAFSSLPRFAEDLAAVLAAIRDHPALDMDRTGLLGHSVGAGAVLLHAARQGGVRAVVSLSAFAHPREMMERWLQAHRIPRRWIGTEILEQIQEIIGERFDHIAPQNQVAAVRCPVLLVHGEHDQTVPLSDAHRLHGLLRNGELLVVSGQHDLRSSLAPHSGRLIRFLRTHLEAHSCSTP